MVKPLRLLFWLNETRPVGPQNKDCVFGIWIILNKEWRYFGWRLGRNPFLEGLDHVAQPYTAVSWNFLLMQIYVHSSLTSAPHLLLCPWLLSSGKCKAVSPGEPIPLSLSIPSLPEFTEDVEVTGKSLLLR
jgi:hypothetical protein